MQMMKLLNMDEVALEVDSENPSHATKLYTDLGYRSYLQKRIMRKPLE
jgi:ribosomal protein S18 acetylase RimI-like enzyme